MAKFLIGTPGDDQFSVQAGDVVIEFPNEGYDQVFAFDSDYTIPANVEELYIVGTGHTGTGTAGSNFLISGGSGGNTLVGLGGDDNYSVGNPTDVVVETASGGYDQVFAVNTNYTIPANVEAMQMWGHGHTAFGDDGNNVFIENGSNTFELGRGHDVTVLVAGQTSAGGTTSIHDFNGTGAANSDVLLFVGYGTADQGATFVQQDTTHWSINSADGSRHDLIEVTGQSGGHANIHVWDYDFLG